MKSEILVIAEAILANTQILKLLLDKLPDAAKAEVAATVNQVTPVAAPVKEAKKPVEVEIPVLVPPKAEIVAPTLPVVAAPTVPTVTLAPVVASPSDCPIKDAKSLMDYVMGAYKALGPQKGAAIQGVLNSIGCQAINEVRADQYAALFAGIEGLKA